MKKINYIQGLVTLALVSVLAGCIDVIPTLVNKDVALGDVNVLLLQNSVDHFAVKTLDLKDLVDEKELNAIESSYIKSFQVTMKDYKNSVTDSEEFEGLAIVFAFVKEGVPFNEDTLRDALLGNGHELIGYNGSTVDQTFNNGEIIFFDFTQVNLKDHIINNKVNIGIALLTKTSRKPNGTPFNDDNFKFSVKVETEVQVAL